MMGKFNVTKKLSIVSEINSFLNSNLMSPPNSKSQASVAKLKLDKCLDTY